MEFLKEQESEGPANAEEVAREWSRRPSHSRTQSTPAIRPVISNERTPLIRRRSFDENDIDGNEQESEPVAGGTILGIHNLAIVFPQFIVALVASAIFKAVDADIDDDPNNHTTYYGKNGVAWVLRFGGVCTLVGCVRITFWIGITNDILHNFRLVRLLLEWFPQQRRRRRCVDDLPN